MVLASVLAGIGVPLSGIALLIGVDRILDMNRTTVNVTGGLTACTVMNRWLRTGRAPGVKPMVKGKPPMQLRSRSQLDSALKLPASFSLDQVMKKIKEGAGSSDPNVLV